MCLIIIPFISCICSITIKEKQTFYGYTKEEDFSLALSANNIIKNKDNTFNGDLLLILITKDSKLTINTKIKITSDNCSSGGCSHSCSNEGDKHITIESPNKLISLNLEHGKECNDPYKMIDESIPNLFQSKSLTLKYKKPKEFDEIMSKISKTNILYNITIIILILTHFFILFLIIYKLKLSN